MTMAQSQFALQKFERQERERARTGGPAFPSANDEAVQYNWQEKGMTLLDHFASQAMAGMVDKFNADEWGADDVAGFAYDVAEAMLQERAKRNG